MTIRAKILKVIELNGGYHQYTLDLGEGRITWDSLPPNWGDDDDCMKIGDTVELRVIEDDRGYRSYSIIAGPIDTEGDGVDYRG